MDGYYVKSETVFFYWLVIGILGTWRLTHLLAVESGPVDIFGKARRLAGTGLIGELVSCFYCLSVWIAGALACVIVDDSWKHRLLLWPALSAGAILLERSTRGRQAAEPIILR